MPDLSELQTLKTFIGGITSVEIALNYLKDQARRCTPPYDSLCLKLLENEAFLQGVGSQRRHHAFAGGLLIHTAEVLVACLALAGTCHTINRDVLVTAAIYHDLGKIHEYELNENGDGYRKTHFSSAIRHVYYSATFFRQAAIAQQSPAEDQQSLVEDQQSLTENEILNVEHVILAHHGRLEWGSPVEPLSAEAYCLHAADMFSASFSPHSIKQGAQAPHK